MSEYPGPDPDFRFRSLDCPVHGDNVIGRVPRDSTKAGGASVIPECVQCAEAAPVGAGIPPQVPQAESKLLAVYADLVQDIESAVARAKIKMQEVLNEKRGKGI
jgi:hypothetical protein